MIFGSTPPEKVDLNALGVLEMPLKVDLNAFGFLEMPLKAHPFIMID